MIETLRRRLSEVDDPARWLGFFSTAIHFGNPITSAISLADASYINDFPEEKGRGTGRKDMSWVASDRGGALTKPAKGLEEYNLSRLSPKQQASAQKVIDLTHNGTAFQIGQQLADEVAVARSMTDEETEAFKGTISAIDVLTLQPVIYSSESLTRLSVGAITYLIYSGMEYPHRTLEQATRLVNRSVPLRKRDKDMGPEEARIDFINDLADVLQSAVDWNLTMAVFLVALDKTGSVLEAMRIAHT